MPIHDWTRVDAGAFHCHHLGWMAYLSGGLNTGRLPDGFYALSGYTTPDGGPPPSVELDAVDELALYAARRRRVTVFCASDDRPMARVEMVTPGDRRSPAAVDRFVTDVVASADSGLAHLVIDPLPAEAHATVLSDWLGDRSARRPVGRQVTLAVRAAGGRSAWSFSHVRIGDRLPDVTLPLAPNASAAVPLAASYAKSFDGMPKHLIALLEGST